jgi:Ring finger domain
MLKCLCNSFRIIITEYTIFIVTLPISYMFLSPIRASCISAGTFIFCTAMASCSWCTRQRQESRQNDGGASNHAVVPEPSDKQHLNGLPPSIINLLPTYVYKKEAGTDSLDCAVCLAGIHQDETVRWLPHCTHLFHRDCIDKWLGFHSTCPVCRITVNLDLKTDINLNVKSSVNQL